MKQLPLSRIKEILKSDLSPARFKHSLAVAKLAKKLAACHRANSDLAERTGLVHDNAKEWAPQKLFSYVRRYRLSIPDLRFIKHVSPNLLHAYVGAHVAFHQGWIDSASAHAVAAHTLADFSMTTLDKIIYVADFAAYDRPYKQARKVRRLAEDNLHQAFLAAMKIKIKFSLKRFKPIHPFGIAVWNHFNDR